MIVTLSSDKGIRQFSISKLFKDIVLFMVLLVFLGSIGVWYYIKQLSEDVLLLKRENQTFVMQQKTYKALEEKHKMLTLALARTKGEKTIKEKTFNIQIQNLKEEKQRIEKEKEEVISRSAQLAKEEKSKKIAKLKLESDEIRRIKEKKLDAEIEVAKRKKEKIDADKKKQELDKKKLLEKKKQISKKEKKRAALLYNIAKTKLGRRYVWGAVGPSVFDCSGFTSYVYKKTGLNIPRTSRNQSKYGKSIKRKELKQGDLIFFDTSRPSKGIVNHVGIYIGNNKFIHASSAQKKVVITSLSKPFYSKRYKGARRVTY